jgi:hypothetical protein
MTRYITDGSLTTDKRDIAVSESWDTQTEWEAYQSATDVDISNGVVTLAQTTIPSSVVLQYYADTWSAGDSTWVDDTGTADMAINGGPSDTTLSDGKDALGPDGTDDYGATTMPASLEGSALTSFSVEFAFQHTLGTAPRVLGAANSANSQAIQVVLNEDEQGNAADGTVACYFSDQDGHFVHFAPSTNPGLDDGNRHDVSIVVNDSTVEDVTMFIDGSEVGVSIRQNGDTSVHPDSFGSWGVDMAHFAYNNAGTIQDYLDADVGAFRWHDTNISSQTIGDY